LDDFFDLLGSDPYARKAWITALRAPLVGGAAKITVMTTGDFLFSVEGEGYAAIGAAQYVTAKNALQKVGESPAVEKDQALSRSLIILRQERRKPIRYQSMLARRLCR
jgi:hypothetical protein